MPCSTALQHGPFESGWDSLPEHILDEGQRAIVATSERFDVGVGGADAHLIDEFAVCMQSYPKTTSIGGSQMGQVVLDITMSLDGFVTAPNDGDGGGLGEDGEVLHYWVFGGPWTYGHHDAPGARASGVDQLVLDELMQGGVGVVGRRMYDVTDGWGGQSPFGPCVVVTHRVDDQPEPDSGFVFVDGVEAAIERARRIAGDKVVGIGGGASIAQQALQAGLVDELQIHIAPVILGAGRTLFGELGTRLNLERTRVLDSPFATHVKYRVLK